MGYSDGSSSESVSYSGSESDSDSDSDSNSDSDVDSDYSSITESDLSDSSNDAIHATGSSKVENESNADIKTPNVIPPIVSASGAPTRFGEPGTMPCCCALDQMLHFLCPHTRKLLQ